MSPRALLLLLLLLPAGAGRAAISSFVPSAHGASPLLRAAELAAYDGLLYPVRVDGAFGLEAQISTRWPAERLRAYFGDWARRRGLAFRDDPLPPGPGGGLRVLRIGRGAAAATVVLVTAESGETGFRLLLPPPRPGLESEYPPILDAFPDVASLPAVLSLGQAWKKESFYGDRQNLALVLRPAAGARPSGGALLRLARERLLASGWRDLVPRLPGADGDGAPLQVMLRRPGWNLLLFASDGPDPVVLVNLFTADAPPGAIASSLP